MAERFTITEKKRAFEVKPCGPEDFELGSGVPYLAEDVLVPGKNRRARVSLYCLDPRDGTAWFVETPLGTRLEDAPFFYVAQFDQAQSVIKLTKDEFLALGAKLIDPGSKLAWVQSVGRSGTTLASRALGTCHRLYSLSEPDALLQWLTFGPESSTKPHAWSCPDQATHDRLFDICVRYLSHEALSSGAYDRIVIKPRSQLCEAFSTILRLYPRSKTLFLTRAPESWLKSVFSALLRDLDCDDLEELASFESSLASYIPLIRARITPNAPQSMGTLWALHYVSSHRMFDDALRAGLVATRLTFEELSREPRRLLVELFQKWGLTWDDDALLRVLEEDSQTGSGLAREGSGRAEYVVPAHQLQHGATIFREFGYF